MSIITLTADQICAINSWPFPCERGKIIDPETVLHGLGTVIVDPFGGGATVFTPVGSRYESLDDRSRWVALATGATIGRAVAVQQAADTVGEAGHAVAAANRSTIGKFSAGLVASPPACDPIAPMPVPVHVGGIWIFIPQPPPPPPIWQDGEQLSGIDLLAVGTRFQVAAATVDAGPLREEFLATSARLFEVGAARL
jgi:hypothetical protein